MTANILDTKELKNKDCGNLFGCQFAKNNIEGKKIRNFNF